VIVTEAYSAHQTTPGKNKTDSQGIVCCVREKKEKKNKRTRKIKSQKSPEEEKNKWTRVRRAHRGRGPLNLALTSDLIGPWY
jgi:hypothetical protein